MPVEGEPVAWAGSVATVWDDHAPELHMARVRGPVRVTFAVPWEGMLLLGTTDTPYNGDPADLAPGSQDARQILREAALALDSRLLDAGRVRATYAGLRVLPLVHEDVAQAVEQARQVQPVRP